LIKLDGLINASHNLRALLFDLKKLRFITTGIINTIFSYVIYATLTYFKVQSSYALLFSTIAGVIFNYFSYKGVVFKKNASLTSFVKHLLAYSIIYFLNVILLLFSIKLFTSNPYFAQLICIPILVILSWILMNKWVFK